MFLFSLLSFCHLPWEQPAPGNPGLKMKKQGADLNSIPQPELFQLIYKSINKENIYFESHWDSEIVTQHPGSTEGKKSDKGELLVPSIALEQIPAVSEISLNFSKIVYKKDFTTLPLRGPGDQANVHWQGIHRSSEAIPLPRGFPFQPLPQGLF